MRFSVRHETRYLYSAPIRLGAHILRLGPRADGIDLVERELVIDPVPVLRRETTDRFGNTVTEIEFAGESDHLVIDSRFVAETAPSPAPELDLQPLPWPVAPGDPLAAYRDGAALDATVRDFAAKLAAQSGREAPAFLDLLNKSLFTRMDRRIRASGYAQTPAETLEKGVGACRDITVLFLAAARSLGLAARFVSGYQAYAETPDGRRHLHAWPEVFLPGYGWRGFDPTHGVAVEDGHVALCAAPDQLATMPIEGGFYGDGVTSKLDYAVTIEVEG